MLRFLILPFLLYSSLVSAQTVIKGNVQNTNGDPIIGANILNLADSTGTTTGVEGQFTLEISMTDEIQLIISHIQYKSLPKTLYSRQFQDTQLFVLEEKEEFLQELEVVSDEPALQSVSSVRISTKSIRFTPVPFQDISNIIATLPSVTSNNELSSAYSVRGGSYDENLVLVNGIPVYRPFLIRSGQEEGLSFVNTDLVSSVEFSAGGWPVLYDDKMASVLSASYKSPAQFGGSAMISLLGGKAHVEGNLGNKLSFLAGVRHKRSAYLLNTLDVEGDYQPRFTDIQTLLTYDLTQDTKVELLYAYARNNYSVKPSTATTSFGTFNQELRLLVAFDGQQQMNYQTNQAAVRVKHRFSDRVVWNNLVSISGYQELENIDLEGGYRLCDVDKNQASDTFNECIAIRGIGTLYNYSRNRLNSTLIDAESAMNYSITSSQQINIGVGYSKQVFEDIINEYELLDSAGYVNVESSILANNNSNADIIKAFAQHTIDFSRWSMTYGLRVNYNALNKSTLVSPRLLLTHVPASNDRLEIKLGLGVYGQQPFYKEFRRNDGTINTDIEAQSSFHSNFGLEYDITWWGRPFKLSTEVYYKYLWNQIPYIIENVRQQYYPDYTAVAKSMGFEARLGGEFIPGTESWFSFGLMSAREKIDGIDDDYIRRPTDQRFKVAFVFEDHIPGDPSLRVNLGFQYGSGLPVGPPDNLELRNSFDGDNYSRVDIGFSKIISFADKTFKSLRLGVEVNNLLGSRNAVSYTWITDVGGNQFAVPNYLTGRLFNVVVSTDF